MKTCAFPAVRLLSLACLVVIFSCNKSGHLPFQGDPAELCPIKRISFDVSGGYGDTITFVYDGLGRPVRGDRTNVGTGSPRYIFRYDNKNRLQDFIGAYSGNGAAEFWTRYTYSKDSRTEWDTTYTLVNQYTTWPPLGFPAELTVTDIKKYDDQGRLIQVFTPFFPPIVFQDSVYTGYTHNFTYDAKGNVEGGVYDNQINYHRTNRVWQFIDDQYSTNNAFPIDAYDIYGLPTKINFNTTFENAVLFGLNFANTVIEYDCGLPKGPGRGL